MTFKNLSENAQAQARIALSQLVASNGFSLDEARAKNLGERVAQAFIAMESYDGATDTCAYDDTRNSGTIVTLTQQDKGSNSSFLGQSDAKRAFAGMSWDQIVELFEERGFSDKRGRPLSSAPEFRWLAKLAAETYGLPERIALS